MKKRIVELLLGITLASFVLTGCSSSNSETTEEAGITSTAEYADTTIYGKVNAVGENTITIEITTQGQMEKPEEKDAAGENVEETADETAEAMPEEPAEETTGEICEFEIGEDTVITRQSMGGHPGNMGEMPEGEGNGEAPEMTEGMEAGEAPEKPEGDANGEVPEMPEDGNMGGAQEEITLADIEVGDSVAITFDEDGEVETITVMSMGDNMAQGGGMMQSGGVESYDAVTEYTTDTEVSDESFTSTGTDENAIHVFEGAEVSLTNVTVDRTSADSTGGDNSSFYGVGAAILNTEGNTYIKDSIITSDAAGGAGIFSYGDGVTYVADTTITTKQDTSGGIHVAGGGTLYAWNLNVETSGESAAAIRSDRGSGTMVVDGGSYTSNGVGSPALYSTADIAVNGATLTANGSEAVCIEGLNSIHLYDSDLTGNMQENEQNDCIWNVILYQSMSGDSEEGNSTFQMQGGSLTAKNGGMFYTTNTESTFILSDVDITYAEDNAFFLKCTGNKNQRGWGSEGSNGADCLFTAISQEMQGDIVWDTISKLDFYMTEGSMLRGAVVNDESCAGNGGDGYCNLYVEEGCTWTVTADSTLTNLYCAGEIVDVNGNAVTIQGSDGTVYVQGDSDITITVSNYDGNADISGASGLVSWSEYEVEKPSEWK